MYYKDNRFEVLQSYKTYDIIISIIQGTTFSAYASEKYSMTVKGLFTLQALNGVIFVSFSDYFCFVSHLSTERSKKSIKRKKKCSIQCL